MKLDNKKTVLVGFAFLAISAFWQMYDGVIPKILTNTFHLGESVSGILMAADNLLGLLLLRPCSAACPTAAAPVWAAGCPLSWPVPPAP